MKYLNYPKLTSSCMVLNLLLANVNASDDNLSRPNEAFPSKRGVSEISNEDEREKGITESSPKRQRIDNQQLTISAPSLTPSGQEEEEGGAEILLSLGEFTQETSNPRSPLYATIPTEIEPREDENENLQILSHPANLVEENNGQLVDHPEEETPHTLLKKAYELTRGHQYDEAFTLFDQVSKNKEAPDDLRALADYKIAKMRYEYLTEAIRDEGAFFRFDKISKNPLVPASDRASAELLRARMFLENRTPQPIGDDTAFTLLEQISKHDNATDNNRTLVDSLKAKMSLENRPQAIKKEEAFTLLDQVSKHDNATASDLALADLMKARLLLENHNEATSNEKAFTLLDQVSRNEHATARTRAVADYWKAIMRVQYRTVAIGDMQAFTLLDRVVRDPYADGDRAIAILVRAFMRTELQKRGFSVYEGY